MKILIVDDEVLICEWLEYCIVSAGEYELVGCAHNGRDALAIFEKEQPDLVLTDIKMPVMDGIELLGAIKKQSPETAVVLLTAFSDFDLAREALQLGATDYILKSEISKDSFQETLRSLRRKMPLTKKEKSGQPDWQKNTKVKEILLSMRTLAADELSTLRTLGLRWQEAGLFAIAIWKQSLLEGFRFPEAEHIRHVVELEYSERIYVIVANVEGSLSEMKMVQLVNEYARQASQNNEAMVGVGRIGSMKDVYKLLRQAAQSLTMGFYIGEKRRYRWHAEYDRSVQEYEQMRFALDNYHRKTLGLKGNKRLEEIESALNYAEEAKVYPVEEVEKYCVSVVEDIYMDNAGSETGLTKQILHGAKAELRKAQTFADMRDALERFAGEYLDQEGVDFANLSPAVARAVSLIQKNYSDALTLEQVAEEANLNPEYLSRLFKEEVGKTYSAFLVQTRMAQAERLLTHTDEKVQRIGEEVGYPNVSYFSTLFKKNFGQNPYEYRRQRSRK